MARTLLLDLDGTLVDTAPTSPGALNRLMVSRGLAEFSLRETQSMIGDGIAVLVGRGFAARGGTPDEQAIADFSRDYGAHFADSSRAFPGVPEFLRERVAEGWRLAVCTNKTESVARRLLETLGLMQMMSAIGGGDSFPVRKPDPAHLLATLRLAGMICVRRGHGRGSCERRSRGAWCRGEGGFRDLGLWPDRHGRRSGSGRARPAGAAGGDRAAGAGGYGLTDQPSEACPE